MPENVPTPEEQPQPNPPPAANNGCGRYSLRFVHTRGGMGRVWRATDGELGRDVAFKDIQPELAHDEVIRQRFVFEAEVTGRLEHPAVIPVYGFGHDASGRPYYAMRFVEGKSLQEVIEAFYSANGPTGAEREIQLRRLLGHFVTVCRAVAFAHSREVIHRDLKPANIMVGDFGEVLVVDWGIAKRLRTGAGEAESAPPVKEQLGSEPPGPGRTRKGKELGSPGYWAPEQAAGTPELHDVRTDVYGLGAVLFAILTGSPPHPLGRHFPEPPSPRANCPWVDEGIDAIARTALALKQSDRYQTAAAVAEAVELWLADQPLVAQRAAVAALGQAADDHPTNLVLSEQFARQRSNLGLMLAGMGRHADAVDEFWASANLFARLADESKQLRLSAEEANCLLSLARSLTALDRADEARTAEQEAADIYKKLVAAQPEVYQPGFDEIMLTASQIDIDLPPIGVLASSAADFDLVAPSAVPEESAAPLLVPTDVDIDLPPVSPEPSLSAHPWLFPELEPVTRPATPPLPGVWPQSAPLPAPLPNPFLDVEPVTRPATLPIPGETTPHPPSAIPQPAPEPPDEVFGSDSLGASEPVELGSVVDIATLFPPDAVAPPGSFRSGIPAIADFELPPVSPAFFDHAGPAQDSVPDIDWMLRGEPATAPEPGGSFLGLSSGYTLLRDLARGGMGRVYLARDETFHRLVVIKTLPDAAEPRAARRFRREVRITGALEHPNLIRAYASGTGADGRPYLVLEYLDGSTLLHRLAASGPGWTPALLDPLAQACDGLHYAHTRGIVHRDAKLANIMVLPSGRTVLLDWGLAKALGSLDGPDGGDTMTESLRADDPGRSRAGAIAGTPAYMSPEQARGGAGGPDPRTDIFTLGANLFHLVSGQPPGHGDELRELITRRRTGAVPRLRDVRSDAPPQLDAICSRAMAFQPEDRYPTAELLAVDIRAFLVQAGAKR